MITNTSSAQVEQVMAPTKKVKYRKETGLFAVEGGEMFSELPEEHIHAVCATEKFLADNAHREMMKGVRKVETVSEDVLRATSDTQTPRDILALARQCEYRVGDISKNPGPVHIMTLKTIQNPRNLGTIPRAREGAGVTGIIINNGIVDIYSPEVICFTMGSVYCVPFVYVDDLRATLNLLRKQNIHLYAAHLAGKNSYNEEDYHGGTGSSIGNEASGLEKETTVMADTLTRIPMLGQAEPLNAVVAFAILIYKTAR